MKKIKVSLTIIVIFIFCSITYAQEDDPVSKAYKIRFKTAAEFEPLVKAMLSNRGIVSISEELNMIVVNDRPTYLSRVDTLFMSFDIPTQQFLVTAHLLLGSNDEKAVSSPDSVIIHELLDGYYSFQKYEELDKAFIRIEEKKSTSLDIGGGVFNISFDIDFIPGASAPIRLRRFELNEYITGVSGKIPKLIYSSPAELRENEISIFTAIKHESTKKTLILLLSAQRI
ncbi:hypothetical protein ACFL7D_02585 [candidate division KSB1 bacterium]